MNRLPLEPVAALLARPQAVRWQYVRNSRRCWTPDVTRALMDRSRQARFSSPSEMINLATLALECGTRCKLPSRDLSDLVARCWTCLGKALKVRGVLRTADAALREAERFERLGTGLLTIRLDRLEGLGSLRIRQGRLQEATDLLNQHLSGRRILGEPHGIASALVQLSIAAVEGGDPDVGLRLATEANYLIDIRKDLRLALISRHQGIRCLNEMGKHVEALAAIEVIHPFYPAVSEAMISVRHLWLRAQILSSFGSQKRDAEAEAAYRHASSEAVRMELPYEAARIWLEMAVLFARRGRYPLLEGIVREILPLLASMGLDRESTVVRLLLRASTNHVQAVEILSRVQRRLDRLELRR